MSLILSRTPICDKTVIILPQDEAYLGYVCTFIIHIPTEGPAFEIFRLTCTQQ